MWSLLIVKNIVILCLGDGQFFGFTWIFCFHKCDDRARNVGGMRMLKDQDALPQEDWNKSTRSTRKMAMFKSHERLLKSGVSSLVFTYSLNKKGKPVADCKAFGFHAIQKLGGPCGKIARKCWERKKTTPSTCKKHNKGIVLAAPANESDGNDEQESGASTSLAQLPTTLLTDAQKKIPAKKSKSGRSKIRVNKYQTNSGNVSIGNGMVSQMGGRDRTQLEECDSCEEIDSLLIPSTPIARSKKRNDSRVEKKSPQKYRAIQPKIGEKVKAQADSTADKALSTKSIPNEVKKSGSDDASSKPSPRKRNKPNGPVDGMRKNSGVSLAGSSQTTESQNLLNKTKPSEAVAASSLPFPDSPIKANPPQMGVGDRMRRMPLDECAEIESFAYPHITPSKNGDDSCVDKNSTSKYRAIQPKPSNVEPVQNGGNLNAKAQADSSDGKASSTKRTSNEVKKNGSAGTLFKPSPRKTNKQNGYVDALSVSSGKLSQSTKTQTKEGMRNDSGFSSDISTPRSSRSLQNKESQNLIEKQKPRVAAPNASSTSSNKNSYSEKRSDVFSVECDSDSEELEQSVESLRDILQNLLRWARHDRNLKNSNLRKLIQDIVDNKISNNKFCKELEIILEDKLPQNDKQLIKTFTSDLRNNLEDGSMKLKGITPPITVFM